MTAEMTPHPAYASNQEHLRGCSRQKVRRVGDQCPVLPNWGGERAKPAKPLLTRGSGRMLQKPSRAQSSNCIFKCKIQTELFMQLKIRHNQIFKPLGEIFKGTG